jgi:hypothetical protein
MPAVEPGPDGLRASDLLGLTVYDTHGRPVGRIADLITEGLDDPAIVAAVVTKPPWGRLLGYERDTAAGPLLLQRLARAVLRRDSQRIGWDELRLSP